MRILGLASKTHDSGIALLKDGVPEIVLEEERFNRRKHTDVFPSRSLRHAIVERGLRFEDIDALTTPWHPKRLARSYAAAVAGRLPQSLMLLRAAANPYQRGGILLLGSSIRRNIRRHFGQQRVPPIHYVSHHDAHAAIFFVSPFEEASVLVVDGYGDDASTSVYSGHGTQLVRQRSTTLFNSLGMVYTSVTQHLGFGALSGEGKVMALAAFGGDTFVARFRDVIRPTPDGLYGVDMSYFAFDRYGMAQPISRRFVEAFGLPRAPGAPIEDRHRDLARALQTVLEEIILHIARSTAERQPSRNLVITGGVALNCVANGRVAGETPFRNVWVPPVASDTGAPLGSALWHQHQTLGRPRSYVLDHASLGREYSAAEIETALRVAGLPFERLQSAALIERVAGDLAQGRIIGWFQGRFEIGPRALGNRSMLADPRSARMKEALNIRVKHREAFRPFAPAILANRVSEYFEFSGADPFMTMAPRVRPEMAHRIAACVHIDGTARLQTVERAVNPRYFDLIAAFDRLTGVPVLLNTSFNEQEPIVASPADAIACFKRTRIDVLAIGDFYCARPG